MQKLRRTTRLEQDMLAKADATRPLPKRACGDCTACCTLVRVEELSKPAYTPCRYLAKDTDNGGCTVYGKRPFACRLFRCAWIEGELAEDERPDRVGFVVERSWSVERLLGFGPIYRVFIAPSVAYEVLTDFVASVRAVGALFDVQTPRITATGARYCYVQCDDHERLRAYRAYEETRGRTFATTEKELS